MAHLIVGPTNSGKSTFIEKNGLSPVIFGFDIANSSVPEYGAIHYNLLFGASKAQGVSWVLEKEPVFQKILGSGNISQVTVIVAPVSELLERGKNRLLTEKSREDAGPYSSDFWLKAIEDTNMFALYETLFDLLESNGLHFNVVYSSETVSGYPQTDRTLVHRNLRGEYLDVPNKKDIEDVISLPGCEYQEVLLPRGFRTGRAYQHLKGDREATFSQLAVEDFQERSILDIGSALGDMLFRAERYGASRLVGIEMMDKRFKASLAIKSLVGSVAEIQNNDFLKVDIDETFDDVLILNVLHHVPDIRSFLHKAFELTNKRLIVEFPTMNDRLFRSLGGFPRWIPGFVLSQLPILGVSHADKDQTYVMTLAAIKRILSEVKPFEVERLKSPISNRELVAFHA